MANSNDSEDDFSDFKAEIKSFRVFQTKKRRDAKGKHSQLLPTCSKSLRSKGKLSPEHDDDHVPKNKVKIDKKDDQCECHDLGLAEKDRAAGLSLNTTNEIKEADCNSKQSSLHQTQDQRKMQNKTEDVPPSGSKIQSQSDGDNKEDSEAKEIFCDGETGKDLDVIIIQSSPKRTFEKKDQRSSTPSSDSKTQTILNSFFDIKSNPTTPVDKKSCSNSTSKKSAGKSRQSSSSKAKRKILTNDQNEPKSKLGRKKKSRSQTQTKAQKTKTVVNVAEDDGNDSDVVCIVDVDSRDDSKKRKVVDGLEMDGKQAAMKALTNEKADVLFPGSSSKHRLTPNRLDEDLLPGTSNLFQESLLDRSEEDVFTGVINDLCVDHSDEDLLFGESDCEGTLLDKSEEDLFACVSSFSKTKNLESCVFPYSKVVPKHLLASDLNEENNAESPDLFSEIDDDENVGKILSCAVEKFSEKNSVPVVEETGVSNVLRGAFADVDRTLTRKNVKEEDGANSFHELTDECDTVVKVDENRKHYEIDTDALAPVCDGFITPEEGESDDEFFAALDENPTSLQNKTNCDVESSASSEPIASLQSGQPISRSSSSYLLGALSSLSSQFSLFSGSASSSTPDPGVDAANEIQTGVKVSPDVHIDSSSPTQKTNQISSKQTSISSFFKAKFSVSSNGVSAPPQSKNRTTTRKSVKTTSSETQSNPTSQIDSSGASNNFDHLQVYSGGKKSCPFYKRIPGTSFTVDAFRYGTIPDCSDYFLTHFHYDHYGGLGKKFNQRMYCNQITCNLVRKKIGVVAKFITVLPMDQQCDVQGVKVTLLDANHCPGAAMILFQLRNGQNILHVGDFRASRAMETYPALIGIKIHQLYLDTTYCDPTYTFPPQEEVIELAVNIVIEAVADNPNTLFVCGTYTIGKERIFLAIADALHCKVCVSKDKKMILECLEDEHIKDTLTLNWEDTNLHILPMGQLNAKNLDQHLKKFKGRYAKVMAFEPTGWTHSKQKKSSNKLQPKFKNDSVTIYGIPYSEHSSYLEMKRFVQFLRPTRILPTVNNGSAKSRQKMTAIFDEWMREK